jgi:hypothetical protein
MLVGLTSGIPCPARVDDKVSAVLGKPSLTENPLQRSSDGLNYIRILGE